MSLTESRLSVCVPICNAGNFLEHCVKSLFSQTMVERMDFIFIDDASDDRSVEILSRMLDENPVRRQFVTVAVREHRGGAAEARNMGLEMAQGAYLAFCDADDRVEPDMYERLVCELEKTGADFAYCGMKIEGADGSLSEAAPRDAHTVEDFIAGELPSQLFNSPCNKVYRLSSLRRSGVTFPTDVTIGEDMLFNVRFALSCRTLASCNFTPYIYRYNPASLSHQRTKKDGESIVGFVDRLLPLLESSCFSAARDRLCRNALLASIRYGVGSGGEWRKLRSRLTGGLTDDARYGSAKRMLLRLASISYPAARLAARCLIGRVRQ